MSTEEQQIPSTSTTKEIQYEQNEIENASSSTAESSNHTLRDDNLEHNHVMPRFNKRGIPITYSKLSDRYTFSFSADLITQFDKYRAHMRESIRQELDVNEEKAIYAESDKNKEEIFSVHQVHHGPATSELSNSQETSTRNRSTDDAPKSCLPTKSSNKNHCGKSFRISFLHVDRQRQVESEFTNNQRRHKSRLTFIKKLPFVSSCTVNDDE
ncbi:14650_t:CDS:2 [Funneliformis geosporum]|uniref:14650_t:CDS:1 n=1 Tax=Funneliformis geosporum TaxID=1117311 RepID=A0A9W4SHW0_9GLOM|nr:14650_t:CDS:2 [Funneliformis geosporum]